MSPDDSGISYEGGDGHNVDSAVIVRGAEDSMEGISAEYKWLEREYPGATLRMQSLREQGGRMYDVLEIETSDGASQEIWFDISDFFGT
jgi:hypothetical protein